jgi:hypothetical protein
MVRPSGPVNPFQKRSVIALLDVTSSQPPSANADALPSAAARNARRGIDKGCAEVGSAGAMPLYVSHPPENAKGLKQLMRSPYRLIVLLAIALGVHFTKADAPPATQPTYQNALKVELADPFIYREGDTYYLYGTAAGDGLLVWTSNDLVNWTERGHAFKRTDESWSRRDFWAPELFKHRDKYYLHFTALRGSRRREGERRVVLAEGDSPLGPFKEIKAPWFETDRPTIDSHVFRDDDGQLYLYAVYLDQPPKTKMLRDPRPQA